MCLVSLCFPLGFPVVCCRFGGFAVCLGGDFGLLLVCYVVGFSRVHEGFAMCLVSLLESTVSVDVDLTLELSSLVFGTDLQVSFLDQGPKFAC